MRLWYWSVLMVAAALMGGCSVVSGVVTDAATDRPMAEVQVGVLTLRPGTFSPEFQERDRTDAEGRYRITHGPAIAGVSFRREGYLTATLNDTTDVTALDVALRPIAAIKGEWDAVILVDGQSIPATIFRFDEHGMRWRDGANSLGTIPYDFDGAIIEIDGFLAEGDVVFGEFAATLALNELADTLTGDVQFESGTFDGVDCPTGCAGTVVATPRD